MSIKIIFNSKVFILRVNYLQVLAQQAPFQPDAYADVTVIIEDVNDHAPVFANALYTASIRENEASGVFVADVS